MIKKLAMIIQKIIISVLLFVVYYLFFGLTAVVAFLFNRKIFRRRGHLEDSNWLDAIGYDKDVLDSKRQS